VSGVDDAPDASAPDAEDWQSDGAAASGTTDFWDGVASDLEALASAEAGELVTYYPGGDTSVPGVELPAFVDRDQAFVGDLGLQTPIVVFLPRKSGQLLVVDEGEDVVAVASRFGETPRPRRVLKVRAADPHSWTLEVPA